MQSELIERKVDNSLMNQKEKLSILIVDDDPDFVEAYVKPVLLKAEDWAKEALPNLEFNPEIVTSQEEARERLNDPTHHYQMALVDLRLRESKGDDKDPDFGTSNKGSGLDLLDYINQSHSSIKTIMFTVHEFPSSVKMAFDAVTQRGAFDYIFKSEDRAFQRNLLLRIRQAWQTIEKERKLEEERRKLEEAQRRAITLGGLVGESDAMIHVQNRIAQVAHSKAPVLITGETGTGKELVAKAIHQNSERGETGTGKELVARAIHQNSKRKDKPFVAFNCGAIPETLIESELFGTVRGAAAGAIDRPGPFEQANGGTIFLDEIGELRLDLQVNLLRVLQEKEIRRLGDTRTRKVDARVIAATNVELQEATQNGRFRNDLYMRLKVITIEMPPLRERKGDIPVLVPHFIQKYSEIEGKEISGASPEAMELLEKQEWPGNVRELENTIWSAIISSKNDVLSRGDVEDAIGSRREVSQLIAALPQALKDAIHQTNENGETVYKQYNTWCKENGKGSRKIEPEEILGILGLAYTEGEVRIKRCEGKLGLDHAKATCALQFLASKSFLKGKRSPYTLGDPFNERS